MIVSAAEFTEPLTVNSLSFDAVPETGKEVTFYELFVDMGYCSSEGLIPNYDSNYISGSKTRVYETTSAVTIQASAPTIVFDTPFEYDPTQGNLIVDIVWPDGEGEFYTYNFPTAEVSSISGAYDLQEGNPFTDMSHLFISYELSLSQSTLGYPLPI